MIIDRFGSMETEVVFLYMPAWEMFFSMHVLSHPEHHRERKRWVLGMESKHRELTQEIRKLEQQTDGWNLVIDSDEWEKLRFLEIEEVLKYLRRMNIIEWNRMIHYYRGEMTIAERDRILSVISRYYQEFYRREEAILFPFLKRMIKSEADRCRRMGIWNWAGHIHERLKVEEGKAVFLKNREYVYPVTEVHTVYATVSTFLSPHLWLYEREGKMELVRSVLVEQKEEGIPIDFLEICKALGDETRLRILREILHGRRTTKELAVQLGITEAAVSKHLRLLKRVGIVEKSRDGNYVKYELVKESIDFIPYRFYEAMQ